MPKSATFTRPSGCTMMLPGLTSRCTNPLAWAKANPSAACATTETESLTLRADSLIKARMVRPGTISMMM